jgi:hypothetical protein
MPATLSPTRTPTKHPAVRSGNGGYDFEQVEHVVFDDDQDTALCGVDQTDVPWDQGFPRCEACRAIDQGRMN